MHYIRLRVLKSSNKLNKEECLPEEKRMAAEEGSKASGGLSLLQRRKQFKQREGGSDVNSHERDGGCSSPLAGGLGEERWLEWVKTATAL